MILTAQLFTGRIHLVHEENAEYEVLKRRLLAVNGVREVVEFGYHADTDPPVRGAVVMFAHYVNVEVAMSILRDYGATTVEPTHLSDDFH